MALTKVSYSMISGAPTNVKDFGAVGNGVADDTTAIQNACAACSANGGGTVYFPAGQYVLTSCLDLGQYNRLTQLNATTNELASIQIHLVGESNTASKIIWKGGTGANGLYGTAVMARSKYFNVSGVNTGYLDCNSIIKNIGFVGGFNAGFHPGGYPLQTGSTLNFSTLADDRAAVSHPSVNFATYPRDPYISPALDTNAVIPDNTAGAAIVYRGQSSGYIEGCSFQKFAYGIVIEWGYGFVIRNNDIRYTLVGIRAQYITTMEVHNNVVERCGCGYFTYGAAQLVEVHENAIQANYAGCDMLFAGFNFQYNVHDNYFEASPNNIILTGDSSGLFRNRTMRFFRNWSVNIRAALLACEVLEFEENLMNPAPSGFTNVWNETSDPVDFQLVIVKNNFAVNQVDVTKPNYLFTDWTLSPTFLDVRDTLPVNKFNPRSDAQTTQAGSIYTRQLRFTTAALGAFLTVTVPNQDTQVALKISEVRGVVGADSRYTTVAEWIVAINRQAGSVAIAQVQNVYNYNLADAGSGGDAGNSTVTTAVSGGATDENGITLRQIGTTVANTATSVFTIEMTIANGQAFMTIT
jgi:hypothetical protein